MTIAVFLLVWCAAGALLGLWEGWGSGLMPLPSVWVLTVSAALALVAAWQTEAHRGSQSQWFTRPWRQWPWPSILMGLAFGYAVWRAFFWLVYSDGRHLWISSRYNLGDLALHWQTIAYFAGGAPLWPESPIFPEGPLRYPAGINLFNALWVSAGVPLPQTLVWFGVLGGLLTAYALAKWGGAWALAMLLFSGGLGGWALFQQGGPCASAGEADWKNLFLSVFVTQRGFLWALPAGLLLMCQWKARLENQRLPLPRSVEWLLLAAMPLFHLHTFLFLGTLMGASVLLGPKERRREFLTIGLAALPLAAPLAWIVTGMGRANKFVNAGLLGWQPGWLSDGTLFYWWWNFGLWLPVFALLGWMYARRVWASTPWGMRVFQRFALWRGKAHREDEKLQAPEAPSPPQTATAPAARVFIPAGLAILGLCFLVRFAPWAWDNVKLMAWCWLALAPWVWQWIFAPLALPARILFLVLLFGAGAVELACGLRPSHRYSWVDRQLLAEAKTALRGFSPAETRIAAAPDVPHPVALLGFPVVCGYPGHLWSHGYNYREVEAALEAFMQTAAPSPLLESVDAVWIGPQERARFKGCPAWNPDSPPQGWRLSWRGQQGTLFVKN